MRQVVSSRGFKQAFTLIELLVVIAIIGVMCSMLLPAIQSSRETARRAQCANHLMQMMLALQNYEQSHDVLPPGVVDVSGPILNEPKGYHFSWTARILPYLGENAIYDELNFSRSVYDPVNKEAIGSNASVFVCPSNSSFGGGANGAAGSCYAACHNSVEAPIDAAQNGTFFLNSSIRRDEVPGGLSRTLWIGELIPDSFLLGWASGTRSTLRNTGTPINGETYPGAGLRPRNSSGMPDKKWVGGFGSSHTGGSQFAFGDGQITFIQEQIDVGVYQRMAQRATPKAPDGL